MINVHVCEHVFVGIVNQFDGTNSLFPACMSAQLVQSFVHTGVPLKVDYMTIYIIL